MAKKNSNTPQGLSAEQIQLLESFYSLPPDEQDAFLDKKRTAKKRAHLNNVTGLQLVKQRTSTDTIEALEYLLKEARSGELIGLAYGGMLRRQFCIVDTAGVAYSNPVFALGVVGLLSHEIAERCLRPD